ncbi:pyruvate-formate lyase [Mycobacteroides abscessus subsp. abscessus]|nr:pyruvate-formate lyase [Mycobacteroides abscessus subsp. abscessus]
MSDIRTDRLDDARSLVPEEERILVVDAALFVGEIRMADTARLDIHDDVVGPGVGHHHVDEFRWRTLATRDDSLDRLRHSAFNLSMVRTLYSTQSCGMARDMHPSEWMVLPGRKYRNAVRRP